MSSFDYSFAAFISLRPTDNEAMVGSVNNTLRPRWNEQHFADDIFKRIFFNANVWFSIKISLKFVPKDPINNIPALVQIMAWRRPGDKPLSEPMIVSLPTHICVTRPQWVKHYPKQWRPSSVTPIRHKPPIIQYHMLFSQDRVRSPRLSVCTQLVSLHWRHMSELASQITSLAIVYSTVKSRRRSKKTSKLHVTDLCAANSPVTGEYPAQRASNAENVSIWWRHHWVRRVYICNIALQKLYQLYQLIFTL